MINLMHGDCLELMKIIPDKSVDMVLTDPPYGTTACKWDVVIPFEPMWEQLKRITKDNGAICLFGSEPFSSHLRLSNLKQFKYDWIWDKVKPAQFLTAKKQPLKKHEIISIFSSNIYYPQMTKGKLRNKTPVRNHKGDDVFGGYSGSKISNINDSYYPKSIIQFSNATQKGKVHPTQKPVALLEYLINTYTLENEIVLDFTMGSGSTGVACKNLNRNFIGIEKDNKYFEIAKNRINNE